LSRRPAGGKRTARAGPADPLEGGALAFDTVLGPCVVAWTSAGVVELHLPDPADGLRRGRTGASPGSAVAGSTGHEGSGAPHLRPLSNARRAPPWIRRLSRRIAGHFEGRYDDFLDVPLDLPDEASPFDRAVWHATREVPPGLTLTYGEVAAEAGRPGAARAAGSALGRCPIPLLIPAHRVIAAGRRPGGWTGTGGVTTKIRLLALEGVRLPGWTQDPLSGPVSG
jgi:methylated-DNA-[protein]-cysteine S-methyltransferase